MNYAGANHARAANMSLNASGSFSTIRQTLAARLPVILCINKTDRYNPHERIENVGGVDADAARWRLTVPKRSPAESSARARRSCWRR